MDLQVELISPFFVQHMITIDYMSGISILETNIITVHTFCRFVYTFMIYYLLSGCFEFEGIDMDERNFRLWMEENKNYHTARTYTARCIRVENEMGIDLDEQYKEDEGNSLMQKLKYSRKESREGTPPQCGIVFDKRALFPAALW